MTRTLFLVLLFLSHSLFAQVNLNQGLVAYYPFNGNANDASGNNINGIVTNATLTTDRNGIANSAYYFDGATSYIQLPYSSMYDFAPQDSFSISVWILPDQGFNSWPSQAVVVKAPYQTDFTTSAWNYGIYLWDYRAMSGHHLDNFLNGTTTFTSTTCWYNIIVTYKNGIWELYVNGVLEASDLSQTNFILQDGPASTIAFGKKGESFGDWYKGKMDEVRIYNRVLNTDEIAALYEPGCTNTCSNWLSTPTVGSYVTTGDVDVAGTQITVEATFNRTAPANSTGGYGFLVSKHTGPGNINYALWPNGCGISTTSNDNALLYEKCPIELNKTYHVAMVYDGSILKFYRDGFLQSQMPLTGNIVTNDLLTTIGQASSVGAPEIYQFLGYINEVRIWNVARTQSEIQTYMNSPLSNPSTQPGLVAYYRFDNVLNKQGNIVFNGTSSGSASINSTNPDCDFILDSCQVSCDTNHDFTFEQSTCNPLAITFEPTAVSFDSIGWDFGDGNILTNDSNPIHSYTNYGNYTVKMIVKSGACSDTVSKAITINVLQDNLLISTNDTTICLGSSKLILTAPSLSSCWTPTDYLDDPNSPMPTTSTPHDITYYHTAKVEGNNLITNGDFSAGNAGFISDYQYSASGLPPGVYFTGTNPKTWNPGMPACVDHTSGNGNMMLVNGAEIEGVKIWSQTVPVQPNTNYSFSSWIENISNTNPARLQFSINGIPLGNIFQASTTSCLWERFYIIWNSGTNSTATISIINKNTLFDGNDFALDDISFAPVYIKRDSIMITVDSPYIKTSIDTTFCAGGQAQLNTTGASTYSWSPATGLSNSNIPDPMASPLSTTKYFITGTDLNGCSSQDSVLITVNPKPVITTSNDTLICKNIPIQLFASGGTTYTWSPPATLNDPSISNPVATTSASTKYYVTVTDANTCTNIDSVMVNVRPDPVFTVSPSTNVCENNSTQLTATGGDVYSWQPAASLSDPTISNPIATPMSTTDYSVLITETACNNSTTLTTTVTVLPPPSVHASKSNDLDCSNDASQLNATGAIIYTWSPAVTLDNPNIQNPIATPTTTTQYSVKGVDASGCSNIDTITVYVTGLNKGGYLMPNAFTPNNDGKNDCYGVKYWGVILELDFSIYNRWGQRIFHTNQPGQCWDGTFNGQPQNPDVYIYMIKAKTFCDQYIFRKGTFTLIR